MATAAERGNPTRGNPTRGNLSPRPPVRGNPSRFAWLTIAGALATVFTHLEPVEDPRPYADEALDRSAEQSHLSPPILP